LLFLFSEVVYKDPGSTVFLDVCFLLIGRSWRDFFNNFDLLFAWLGRFLFFNYLYDLYLWLWGSVLVLFFLVNTSCLLGLIDIHDVFQGVIG
jgi:hypothetical protein